MFLEELMLLFHIRTCKIECGLHCDGISTLTRGSVGNLQFWNIFLISIGHSLHSLLVCNCALVLVFLTHLPVRCCNITRVLHATLCFCISNRTATVRKKCPTHFMSHCLHSELLCGIMCSHMQCITVYSRPNLIYVRMTGIKSEVSFSLFSTHYISWLSPARGQNLNVD